MEINKHSGQVEIISPYGRVYLYTHLTADTLVKDVYAALAMRMRWDDADYLSKMIFCRMVPMECWNNDGGFGIGTQLYADVNLLITLDTVRQVITIQSALDKHYKYCMTFDEFVMKYLGNAEI